MTNTDKNLELAMAIAGEIADTRGLSGAPLIQKMDAIDNLVGQRVDGHTIHGRPALAWPVPVAVRALMPERIARPPRSPIKEYWSIISNLSPNRGTVVQIFAPGERADMDAIEARGSANAEIHVSRGIPVVVGDRVWRL